MEVEIVLFENLCFADCVFEKHFLFFVKCFSKQKMKKFNRKRMKRVTEVEGFMKITKRIC